MLHAITKSNFKYSILFCLLFSLNKAMANIEVPAWAKGEDQQTIDADMQAVINKANQPIDTKIESEVRELVQEIESRDYSQEEQEIKSLFSQFSEGEKSVNCTNPVSLAKYQLPANHEILIFVSLSLSKTLLLQLQQQAKDYGAILVLRGLKNNSFQDTYQAIHSLIQEQEIGFSIDPELFDKFGVTQVPSMVFYENNNCPKNINCSKFDKISGNVSIDYFLKKIREEGDLALVLKEGQS